VFRLFLQVDVKQANFSCRRLPTVESAVFVPYNARRPNQDAFRVAHKRVGEADGRGAGSAAPRFAYLHSTLRQLLLCAIALPLVSFGYGIPVALSLLCGAACAVLPQAWFALRMQRAAGFGAARAARLSMAAEGGKFVLSAVAFAVVFAVVKPAQPLLVFVGYAVVWLLQVGDALRLLRQPQR
jgi:ATP synthase protein I